MNKHKHRRQIFLALLVICILAWPNLPFAQETVPISCGSDAVHQDLLQSNPPYAKRMERFQQIYIKNAQQTSSLDKARSATLYTIPVVVHIIHDGSSMGTEANPTDETVKAIIQEASDRFRHMHAGAGMYANPLYGIDTEIDLCLADTDPNGNYSSGVTRHYDPANATGDYGDIAPALNNHVWDKSKYCNLYIVKSLTNASGVYMGFYDFTIYDSPAFWSGLIAHEVGHYFNLRHTFQSNSCTNNNCLIDGDGVCDTPPKASSGLSGGSCATPSNSCTTDDDDLSANNPYRPVGSGGVGDQPDMLANYMDYTGGCWDSFTSGQKTRMRSDIENFRAALKDNAAACSGFGLPADDIGAIAVSLNQPDACTAYFTPEITIKNYGASTLTTATILIDIDGALMQTTSWSGSLLPGASISISLSCQISLTIGTHLLRCYTSLPNGNADANIYNDSEYITAAYIGGTSCQTENDCTDFNPNTASGAPNNTIVNVTATYPALPSSATGVQICVTAEGDVGFSLEVFDVYDEDNVLRGQTNFSADCAGPTPPFCFMTTIAEYNNWKSDGIISVTLSPIGTYIDPTRCTISQACVDVNIPQGEIICDPTLVMNGTIITGIYEASNFIQSGGTIYNASCVTFGATNYVELMGGFEVEQGAVLVVSGVGCE